MIKFYNADIIDAYFSGSQVTKMYLGSEQVYGGGTNPYLTMHLTFKIISGGTIVFRGSSKTVEYSTDSGETWTQINSSTSPSISVNAGDEVMFRGDNNSYSGTSFSSSTAMYELQGNLMSLIDSTGFSTAITITSKDAFYNVFRNCTGLTSLENFVMPATNLANRCYRAMFIDCKNLTTAPAIFPATTLKADCYYYMFQGCSSLTSLPALPATDLSGANRCYEGMFQYCTALTTVPSNYLPATNLRTECYRYMFDGCTSLVTAPALPATTLANYCYGAMFRGCTSLETAPDLPATTLAERCYYCMFQNCSSLNYINCQATSITATNCTLGWVNGVAENGNFVRDGSTMWGLGVNAIPKKWVVTPPIDYSTIYLTLQITNAGTIYWRRNGAAGHTRTIEYSINDGNWTSITSESGTSAPYFNVVAGDLVRLRGTNSFYATGASAYNSFSGSTATFDAFGNVMSLLYGDNFIGQTALTDTYSIAFLFRSSLIENANHLSLPAMTLSDDCYRGLFYNCSGLTSSPEFPATAMTVECYREVFQNCTALTSGPSLPATSLAQNCYRAMYYGCSGLTTAPDLPATTLAVDCYRNMFYNCSNLLTTPKLLAETMVSGCCYGMFYRCLNITSIICLATNISASQCTNNWVYGINTLGTFYKNKNMVGWTTGNSGVPPNWTVRDYSDE